MMRRRNFTIAAAGAVLALGLGACGGGSDGAASPSGATEITFWNGFTSGDRAAVEQIVKNFNDSQSDVKVNMTITAWDSFYQKLLPAYAAGNGPTVAGLDALQLPGYAEKGVFAPLDDLYSDWPDAADIPQSTQDVSMYDGKQYGAPMSVTQTMLYYNKTLLDAAGITPPTTLDELAADSKTLTKLDAANTANSQYGFLLPDHGAVNTMTVFAQANGGGVISADGDVLINDPATVSTVQTWVDLVRNDKISPVGLSGEQADTLFSSGKAAFYVNGPWAGGIFTEAGIDYGVVNIPAGSATQAATLNAVTMSVDNSADAKEKAAAYSFIKFWNSPEQQKYWSVTTNNTPSLSSVTAADLAENPVAAAFAEGTGATPYISGQVEFNKIDSSVVVPTWQKAFNGEGTVPDLMDAAASQIEPLLNK